MALSFVNTTVSIGGEPIGTLDPDARTTTRCAWSPAVIRRGYADTLDPPEPSTLTLRLTVPDGMDLPTYGQRVEVHTTARLTDAAGIPRNSMPGRAFLGHIDGATRRRVTLSRPGDPLVEGWALDITASGSFATLARTMIGDVPWPAEGSGTRMLRIQSHLPPGWIVTDGPGPHSIILRARDVDNRSALDLIRRSLLARNNLIIERLQGDAPGIQLSALPLQHAVRRDAHGAQAYLTLNTADMVDYPAAAFIDADRELDVASVVNSVAISGPDPADPDSDRDYVLKAAESIERYGESQWRAESDALDVPADMEASLTQILARRAEQRWQIGQPLDLDLRAIEGTSPNDYRHLVIGGSSQLIRITDAPADIEPVQRIIGSTLTLHGDPSQQHVSVYLEAPDASYGAETLVLDATRGPIHGDPTEDLKIEECQNLTFHDFLTVSRAELNI